MTYPSPSSFTMLRTSYVSCELARTKLQSRVKSFVKFTEVNNVDCYIAAILLGGRGILNLKTFCTSLQLRPCGKLICKLTTIMLCCILIIMKCHALNKGTSYAFNVYAQYNERFRQHRESRVIGGNLSILPKKSSSHNVMFQVYVFKTIHNPYPDYP